MCLCPPVLLPGLWLAMAMLLGAGLAAGQPAAEGASAPEAVPSEAVPYAGVVDSTHIRVRLHPGAAPVTVRIRGISAPSRAIQCSDADEQTRLRAVAMGLVDSLNELLRRAKQVRLEDAEPDAGGGLVATVLVRGQSLGAFLLRTRLAKPLGDAGDQDEEAPAWCS